MNKHQIFRLVALTAIAVTALGGAKAKAQGVFNPCPDIIINERVDHVPYPQYAEQGWDTVINRMNHGTIMLTAEPYIPVQYFNGTYIVEQIPYNPPDTTFYLNYPQNGPNTATLKRLDITSDDKFDPTPVNIAFPFYFFGQRKTYFRLGDNGLVTFTTKFNDVFGNESAPSANHCPYSYSSGLPWSYDSTSSGSGWTYTTSAGSPTPKSEWWRIHDAILGVFEDTHPTTSSCPWPKGIYYGVVDNYPCRKIIATWNDIPLFGNSDQRNTYQIVCYEGSNIIEVHVKRRGCCSSTISGIGTIGIQNATGLPQKRGTPGQPNMLVENGAPSSFAVTSSQIPGLGNRSWNPLTSHSQAIDTVSFRFTPQGKTSKTITWYRVFDDGRDSVVLTQNVNDTNGYYDPMHDDPAVAGYDPVHPTLTKAWVSPTIPSTYVMHLFFEDAEGNPYHLYDTIRIGIDTANALYLRSITPQDDTVREQNICNGRPAALKLTWGDGLTPRDIQWNVDRVLNGKRIQLPESMYEIDPLTNIIQVHADPRFDTLPKNHIDSIRVMASVDFISGSSNFDTFMVRVFPNFDTINIDGICNGETYHWRPSDTHGHTYELNYTVNTNPDIHYVTLQSMPGCDSIVRLDLTVFDISLTTDTVESCREYTWRNGRTYTENNWATMENDTVVLKNKYDCDSIVRLFFTIYPLRSVINCDVEKFTYDNLDAQLVDASVGLEASRMWYMPALDFNGDSTTIHSADPMVYFNLPAKLNGATIKLISTSPYGCQDSTSIYLPMEKETMWIPTAFTPDDPAGNNIFSSRSVNTEQQEMWIYDRSGRLVAHCAGVDCGWDGRDLKGNPCPQGAYVYVIKYTTVFQPRQTLSKHGSITLIR